MRQPMLRVFLNPPLPSQKACYHILDHHDLKVLSWEELDAKLARLQEPPHPATQTLNPQPKPLTLNLQPSTLNPQASTLNPKP